MLTFICKYIIKLVFIFTFPISLAIVIGLLIAGDWDDN